MISLKKLPVFIIAPGLLITAAASPLSCNLSKDGGVYKSKDAASNWEQKVKISDKKGVGSYNALSFAIDSANSKNLYLGTGGNGLYKSADEGETWKQIEDKNKIFDKAAAIYDIKMSPRNSNLIYAAVYQGNVGRVLRSEDAGESWKQVYLVSSAKYPVLSIAVSQINEAVVFIGTAQGGLFKSVDHGSSWELLKWFSDRVSGIEINPNNDNIIYLATASKGLHKSTDQGKNWQVLSQKTQTSSSAIRNYASDQLDVFAQQGKIQAIMLDSKNSETIFVASEKGLLVSNDSGQTWRKINILLPEKTIPILTIAQDSQNPSIIYYSAGAVIYKTVDGGQTWTVNKVPSARRVRFIEISPTDSNIVYVGMGS
ncbi:MAG: hypothetical protein HY764_01205 [Candidatus Portnoybacteria bacterium]|nr:hypothetical protein [Candidatus Portnoybacteria bacterium]